MGSLKDHFFGDRPYPHTPGYKTGGPSIDAAQKIAPRAETLRDRALEVIRKHPSTADEVASILGETVLATRPRITELSKTNKIIKTGERRANASGIKATVWKAV